MPVQDDLPTPPPASVDPATRLALARLTSADHRLAGDAEREAAARRSAGPAARLGALGSDLGAVLFPTARGRGVGRLELAAFGAAMLGATLIGVALPHPQPVQAQAQAAAPLAALPAALTPAPAATPSTPPAADEAPDPSDDAADAATPAPALATPAAASTASATAPSVSGTTDDDAAAGDEAPAADGDGDAAEDPLGAGDPRFLRQVAVVTVHGDAPVRWRDAPAGSPARARAALGTTFTGYAQLPAAPLASAAALFAGQPSNPALRAGCDAPAPIAPGTIGADGRVAGSGCDFPAGTASLPTAVATDGRRWKAYAPVATPELAKAALCGTPGGGDVERALARVSMLAHLADLGASGACEGAAAPVSALATDLASGDDAPAWLSIDVGRCAPTGCDEAAAADRDRDLDAVLATLTGPDGLGASSAVIVVGDGTPAGLAPAEPGTLAAAPDDPAAPAAVAAGALLIGAGVGKDAVDPLALDPLALARTQAAWLGLTPPGLAAAEGVAPLALPSA